VTNRALNATLKGLEEVVATATELKIYNLDDLEFHPAYQTLEKARAPIKACHDRLFEVRLASVAAHLIVDCRIACQVEPVGGIYN
jgi:hypothetical protein